MASSDRNDMIDAVLTSLIGNFCVNGGNDNKLFDYMVNASRFCNFVHDMVCKSDSKCTLDHVAQRVSTVLEYRATLSHLLSTPQVEQRSSEWYEMRRGRLTASAIAEALGQGKYRSKNTLLKSKAFPELDKPFDSYSSPPLRHGIILEDMSARCYQQRRGNIKIHNFGMIPHPDMSCFGASPDGINELGIMIEIKTPYKRKVGGEVPHEYMLQMQGQMAVCGLKECDFVDAEIKMNVNIDEYINTVEENLQVDHGMIVEYCDAVGDRLFDYSPPYLTPKECMTWANDKKKTRINEFGQNNVKLLLAWRLEKIHIERVLFDSNLWESLVPKIEQFWTDVLNMRLRGISCIEGSSKKPRKETTLNIVLDDASLSPPKDIYTFVDSDSD
jgi:putative phage-type endonuclease